MQTALFVARVQELAHLASRSDAERAVRAVFETFAERVTQGATTNLAAQLPREIAQYLLRRGPEVRDLSPGAFWEHVAAREGVEIAYAIRHARAVFQVLHEAVSAGEMEDFAAELPAALRAALQQPLPAAQRTHGNIERGAE
ncbi:MAG TPA: DUF2267 domain-containing protein [Gemmatimonadaceae bacterium]|nr:DUF2267 domain-containing protein [Gemmatimonadaceae bacterium]